MRFAGHHEPNMLYDLLENDTIASAGAGSAAGARDGGERSLPDGGQAGVPGAGSCGGFCAEGGQQPAATSGTANAKVGMLLSVHHVTHLVQHPYMILFTYLFVYLCIFCL